MLSSSHALLDGILSSGGVVGGVSVGGVAVKSSLGGTRDGGDFPVGSCKTIDFGSLGAPGSVGHCVRFFVDGAEVSHAGKGVGGFVENQSLNGVITSEDCLVIGSTDVLGLAVRADELVFFFGGAKDGNDIISSFSEFLGDYVVHMLLGELFAGNSSGDCNFGGFNRGSISGACNGVGRGRDDSGEESSSKGLHDHLCFRNIISFLFVKSLGIYNS